MNPVVHLTQRFSELTSRCNYAFLSAKRRIASPLDELNRSVTILKVFLHQVRAVFTLSDAHIKKMMHAPRRDVLEVPARECRVGRKIGHFRLCQRRRGFDENSTMCIPTRVIGWVSSGLHFAERTRSIAMLLRSCNFILCNTMEMLHVWGIWRKTWLSTNSFYFTC